MAHTHAEPHPPLQEESAMDYAQHQQTYSAFVTAVKWSIPALAVTAIVLYFAIKP